jgi:hypothetical protein
MEISRLENLPPPPGIINSIRAGFDSVANHIGAIFLPLFLNVFLWLGPRLKMDALYQSIKGDMIRTWQLLGISAEQIQLMMIQNDETSATLNLFSLLRTLPIGTPSLFPFRGIDSTPLGEPAVWQVNALNFPFWMMLLVFVGWILGAFYFRAVALVATPDDKEQIHIVNAILQTIFISIFCGILFIIFAPFLTLILGLVFQLSRILAIFLVLILSFTSIWVIVPIFFLPHAVFVFQRNIFGAIKSSFNFARFTLPNSSLFVLTTAILAFGLNFLWRIPKTDSWLMLIGIFGHSFVTTALLASSFIYYRDMTAWATTVLEKLKSNKKIA